MNTRREKTFWNASYSLNNVNQVRSSVLESSKGNYFIPARKCFFLCSAEWRVSPYCYEALELQTTVLLLLGYDEHRLKEQHLTRLVVLFHQETLVPQFTEYAEICQVQECEM